MALDRQTETETRREIHIQTEKDIERPIGNGPCFYILIMRPINFCSCRSGENLCTRYVCEDASLSTVSFHQVAYQTDTQSDRETNGRGYQQIYKRTRLTDTRRYLRAKRYTMSYQPKSETYREKRRDKPQRPI